MGNGGRLGLMAFVAFIFLQVGLTGRLGSLLAVLIDPAALSATVDTSGGSNGASGGLAKNLPRSGTLTPVAIGEYALNAGFPANTLQTAIAVALAESGGRVSATNRDSNGTTDYGLWQINSVHGYPASTLLTPDGNASAAYTVSAGGTNWHPWTTYQNGAYQQFMDVARAAADLAING